MVVRIMDRMGPTEAKEASGNVGGCKENDCYTKTRERCDPFGV